ncbi:phosphate-starvation-inducible protein PsiE [Methylophilus medardicus]|uniref:Protein PsiE n=1 Tax=Methylophilus medardicus TaxID=2588534 RepID=A0A5B8CT93_9PROT|nr:phosphate-starvation-inducible PsiE family protein [Methylophilus medardicus]QDC44542.1 phosphate-starvation-inducible E [Methylophilus medardicus]QDC49549.1 phosphate-starvation-inducible E [Methylophilus medardicus]QDC53254.1 phosphate-starvation-inducible E [Methylophilus medardicus]
MKPPYEHKTDKWAHHALMWIERLGLGLVTLATFFSLAHELSRMWQAGMVGLGDLLQLFLYLEVFSMINSYFGSGKLPMRYPIYIAMVALARYLLLDMKEMTETHMLAVSAAILILAISVLVMRFGHSRYPYEDIPQQQRDLL